MCVTLYFPSYTSDLDPCDLEERRNDIDRSPAHQDSPKSEDSGSMFDCLVMKLFADNDIKKRAQPLVANSNIAVTKMYTHFLAGLLGYSDFENETSLESLIAFAKSEAFEESFKPTLRQKSGTQKTFETSPSFLRKLSSDFVPETPECKMTQKKSRKIINSPHQSSPDLALETPQEDVGSRNLAVSLTEQIADLLAENFGAKAHLSFQQSSDIRLENQQQDSGLTAVSDLLNGSWTMSAGEDVLRESLEEQELETLVTDFQHMSVNDDNDDDDAKEYIEDVSPRSDSVFVEIDRYEETYNRNEANLVHDDFWAPNIKTENDLKDEASRCNVLYVENIHKSFDITSMAYSNVHCQDGDGDFGKGIQLWFSKTEEGCKGETTPSKNTVENVPAHLQSPFVKKVSTDKVTKRRRRRQQSREVTEGYEQPGDLRGSESSQMSEISSCLTECDLNVHFTGTE